MNKRAFFLCLLVGFSALIGVRIAWAHASLLRSDPAANASLSEPPKEIRLRFSESIEPNFSTITLWDAEGKTIPTASAAINPLDYKQLVLPLDSLPKGLYTVVWRVVTHSDGHTIEGSFVFGIGVPVISSTPEIHEPIPVNSAAIRWINLFSLAFGIGGIAFGRLVWQPALGEAFVPKIEARLRRLVWVGWLLIGLASFLLLLLQVSAAKDISLGQAISDPALKQIITDTYFGKLWLWRVGLWLLMGGLIYFRRDWLALALGGGVILTHSLFSHAASSTDQTAAVAADWLHVAAMVLWLGGLAQFLNIIGAVRRHCDPALPILDKLVAYFSNFARSCVAALVLTGLYSAWLHVGSWDGLRNTVYGQALLLKLILFLPLLGVAGINLFLTGKALHEGHGIWAGRLRGLVSAEIVLLMGILAAGAVMTAGAPSRNTLAARAALPKPPDPTPIDITRADYDMRVNLNISPGWVGENTFTVRLTGSYGELVKDAAVGLRFEYNQQDIGQTEISLTEQADGTYSAAGANLSAKGDWRIRVTVQRANQNDVITDFTPTLGEAPPASPPKLFDDRLPLRDRQMALLLIGLAILGLGGFFLRGARWQFATFTPFLLIAVGAVMTISGVALRQMPVSSAESFEPPPDAPVKIALSHDLNLPWLIRADGTVLQPTGAGKWRSFETPAPVRDIYTDNGNQRWIVTDEGMFLYADAKFEQISVQAAERLLETHGYLYGLGAGRITRVEPALGTIGDLRQLNVPDPQSMAENFLMLGNHSHILQNGAALFGSSDLGLSWKPLEAPYPVTAAEIDGDGNLIISTDKGLLRWTYVDQTWHVIFATPPEGTATRLVWFSNRLYGLINGKLYRQTDSRWAALDLPEASEAYLFDLKFQYPDKLWTLDALGSRLWVTQDGNAWTMTPIEISDGAP